MKQVIYTGQQKVAVEQVGDWSPGEIKSVPDALATRLLKLHDFNTNPPTPKLARATAKAKSATTN